MEEGYELYFIRSADWKDVGWLVDFRFKSNFLLMRTKTIRGILSVGVFLSDRNQFLCEFWRKPRTAKSTSETGYRIRHLPWKDVTLN